MLLIPELLPTIDTFSDVTSSEVYWVSGTIILAEYWLVTPPWGISTLRVSPTFAPIRNPSMT